MSEIIDGRLSSVAKFVRWGATFADIGTDHAYLPVFLVTHGVINHAICSDINEGPLSNAMATATEYGVYDKIDFVLTDGARALSEYKITDMAICGMGGELIADIIEAAPFIKKERVRLILQPMTRQENLRVYLYENGFSLIDEDYVCESGKCYIILVAEYTGIIPSDTVSPRVKYGEVSEHACSAQYEYLCTKKRSKQKAYNGILAGGKSDCALCEELEYIEELLEKIRSRI